MARRSNDNNKKISIEVLVGVLVVSVILLIGNFSDSALINRLLEELEINSLENVEQTNPIANTVNSTTVDGNLIIDYIDVGQGDSILIRQEPEFLEAILGCEEPNVYHVFGHSPYGYKYLFKCFEQSECCERLCCPSGKREFNMDIIHCNSYEQLGMGYNEPFANFHKPFMCAVGCCCRPEITVSINSTKKTTNDIIKNEIHASIP